MAHDYTHADNRVDDVNERPITQYAKTRDEQFLRLREGVTPTWFYLRRLPAAWMAQQLDPLFHRAQQRVMAVRAALHQIETATDGKAETLQTTPMSEVKPGTLYPCTLTDHGVQLAPMEWVQEIADRWGAETVQEMGELIITMSRLPRGRRGPFGWWGGTVASS
jgi:hypothetical protein